MGFVHGQIRPPRRDNKLCNFIDELFTSCLRYTRMALSIRTRLNVAVSFLMFLYGYDAGTALPFP
jgi:hypothetical protein